MDVYRVRIEASGEALGSIWAEREPGAGEPALTPTRLLAAAADQIGQAMARDRVAQEVQAAEVARQGDQLKTSLLQSVSHDFRTPLAVIRAAAGSLDSDSTLSPEDRHANTQAIEREVEYLNALVANLLDMSRIEAGALRAERDLYDLDDLLTQPLERVRRRLGGRRLDVDLQPAVVRVDAVFVDSARDQRAGQRHQVHARRTPRSGSPPRRWTRPRSGSRSRTADPASHPRCSRACSRSSTGSRARAADRGAAWASGSRWSAASSRRPAAA